jgi:putative ABC transport system substrate-binding protein
VEGQNILLDYRFADGKADRFPALASELVQLAPDVLWLHTNPAARAAMRATTTIPIVVAVSIGLVENKLVASLARPGGNLTGLELPAGRVSGRRLELLKEALPTISRVAVLVDPGWQGRAGQALGLQLQPVQASSPADFDAAFAAIVHGKADALMFMKSALFAVNRRQLGALALRHRLPTMSFALPFAEEGSLLAYGADPREMSHRSAVFVHKILQGTKPSDLVPWIYVRGFGGFSSGLTSVT